MTIDVLLTEGIKYFKLSSRIDEYIKKISKKKIEDNSLSSLVKELKSLQKSFKKLEAEYKKASSKEELKNIKARWKVLKVKNEKILSLIRNDDIKKTAIIIGIFAVIVTVLLLLKKGIDKHIEEIDDKLDYKKNLGPDGDISGAPHNTQYDENGKRIVPEQIHNPNLEKAEEIYRGFVMPEPGEYSRNDIAKLIKEECIRQKFPVEIAKAIAKHESSLNARAISPDGYSVGVMQLNVKFSDEFATKYYTGKEKFNPFEPKHNIEAGIRFFKYLLKKNGGDIKEALLDYNAGPNRTKTTTGTFKYAEKIMNSLGANKDVIKK